MKKTIKIIGFGVAVLILLTVISATALAQKSKYPQPENTWWSFWCSDSDGDGYVNVIEANHGTDMFDKDNFPYWLPPNIRN